jgi:acyl transferase domain-containing protein
MGGQLYEREKVYREQVDECARHLEGVLGGVDIREVIRSGQGLEGTELGQPALFVVEYSLARLWESWGIRAVGMIGHSLGEYVAGCLSGVFGLKEGLELVAWRGQLMGQMSPGAMIAVGKAEEELEEYKERGLSVAAVNGPEQVVLSGSVALVKAAEKELQSRGIWSRRLGVSRAFHSPSMGGMVAEYERRLAGMELKEAGGKYVSNVTGKWVDGEEKSSGYWIRHLLGTVRFWAGLEEIWRRGPGMLLEVGPGRTLKGLVGQRKDKREWVASSFWEGADGEQRQMLEGLGELWVKGVGVDWQGYWKAEKRRRVPLPTYPFERQRYWIEAARPEEWNQIGQSAGSFKPAEDLSNWFYVPGWIRTPAPRASEDLKTGVSLVFLDTGQLGAAWLRELELAGTDAVIVTPGLSYQRKQDRHFAIRPEWREDYEAVIAAIRDMPG